MTPTSPGLFDNPFPSIAPEASAVPNIITTNSEVTGIERIFPIRITNANQEPPNKNEKLPQDGAIGSDRPAQACLPVASPLSASQDPSPPSIFAIHPNDRQLTPNGRFVTNRFDYVPGGVVPSTVPSITGRKIYRCEDEPIHIPGAIQRLGALIAVREEHGFFVVRVVSENSHSIIGLEPEALFQLDCLTDILPSLDKHDFTIRARILRADIHPTSPDVFSISLTPIDSGTEIRVFCAMHMNKEADLIVCELEIDQNLTESSRLSDAGFPKEPVQKVDNEASEAERLLSTTPRHKPLYILKVAKASSRPLNPMDLFRTLAEIQEQASSSTSLTNLADTIVGLVHDLTGFHRVMVYQFDNTGAGSVISELIDPRASKDLYRGLHFPASDIPKQARELYMINTIRILYNRQQETARLVCRTFDDARVPLDLKHSYLRAMSPVHLKYLANMGVQASMSISLIINSQLWGLISCHNYGSGSGISVPLPIREVCRGLGSIASSNIQRVLLLTRIAARRPLVNAPPAASPFLYITSSTADLLNMFGADFGFLVINGEARTIGKLHAYQEAIVLLHHIRQHARGTVWYSHAITQDFPSLSRAATFLIISGMLVVPLSMSGTDHLVFFRKGQIKQIEWAGNPYEKNFGAGDEYLEPRNSFKRWSERVIGTSREWTEDEVESATVLTTLYGRFIEVWRQKEAIVQRNRMTRKLIQNAGHNVRTPLNSIINYLEVALEDTLDEKSRKFLQRSLQASKSLVHVVNDLLNLTEVEGTAFDTYEENVDLRATVADVAAAFRDEATRKKLDIRLNNDPAIPHLVRCEPTGMRQVISNLLANGVQNSENGQINISMEHIETTQTNVSIKISFADHGRGLSEEQLDSIFQDFEQILEENEISTSDEQGVTEAHSNPIQIGLGLATAARYARLHSGQISMSSTGEGKGTKVSLIIPFRKALQGTSPSQRNPSEIALPTPPSDVLFAETSKSSNSEASSPTPVSGPSSLGATKGRYPFPILTAGDDQPIFSILVAEDNPLNSRLLETRLKRRGHSTQLAVDGISCIDAFKSAPQSYDIILMDIQVSLTLSAKSYEDALIARSLGRTILLQCIDNVKMPIVDGIEATRMIRVFEKDLSSAVQHSARAATYGRIPIIAVSASLSQDRVHEYIDSGFDGWVLKPIDFNRLEAILTATEDEKTRKTLLYGHESWEKGGWFDIGAEKGQGKK